MAPLPDDKIDQACQVGQEFSKLYYETIDKKRHLLNKLYMDSAEAVWNGNHLKGKEAIIKFYEDLPMSEHKIESLDCHPLADELAGGQPTVIVKVYGTVKFTNVKSFNQSFLLTNQSSVWKIISDCFRFQDKSDS